MLPVTSGARAVLGLQGVFHGRDWGGSARPELLLLLLCGAGEGREDTSASCTVRKGPRFSGEMG